MVKDDRHLIYTARTKLVEYIDALWAGRTLASAPLQEVYTLRLAAAARLSALLGSSPNTTSLKSFIREENGEFPRDFLITDDGRAVRAAFNHVARAVAAIESHHTSFGQFPTGPESIVGSQLSGVNFVLDYVQLVFDDSSFSVLCPIVVDTPQGQVQTAESGFRDGICEPIGQIVRSVSVTGAVVTIGFERHRIAMHLSRMGSTSPEALIFTDHDGRVSVFR